MEMERGNVRVVSLDASNSTVAKARTLRGEDGIFCQADLRELGWIKDSTFDGVITFGALADLFSPKDVCRAFREMLRVVRPGGRVLIGNLEHTSKCRPPSEQQPGDMCGTCHWNAGIDNSFWAGCIPMHQDIALSTHEHKRLAGAAEHGLCADANFALLAHKSSMPHEMKLTTEPGEGENSNVAVMTSLAEHSMDKQLQRRIKFMKEVSLDNKRLYCQLHGYTLVIGENLRHSRSAGWDTIKLMNELVNKYQWMLWAPIDTLFADVMQSLEFLKDPRVHLIIGQDNAIGDSTGAGVLTEVFLLRGKSDWSKNFLQMVWVHSGTSMDGTEHDAVQYLLTHMDEEERAQYVKFIDIDTLVEPVQNPDVLPWKKRFHSDTLMVSFANPPSSSACPTPANDREMLECSHQFHSYYLKSMQLADARYKSPTTYEMMDMEGEGGGGLSVVKRQEEVFKCPDRDKALSGFSRVRSAADCLRGSTWLSMDHEEYGRFVRGFGRKLGLTKGASVLDGGSACGHSLRILQKEYKGTLKAVGVDSSEDSVEHAKNSVKGKFCVGDVRKLSAMNANQFDVVFTVGTLSLMKSERDICGAVKEMGRLVKPGGRLMIVSAPKGSCAKTEDKKWDCPKCYWEAKNIPKEFWLQCVSTVDSGAFRVAFLSNTDMFSKGPYKYCHREHYSVVLHKKPATAVQIFVQAQPKIAVLTVASTPPVGEYGKQKVHYLMELSLENKRHYCARHGYDFIVAENLRHGRTARWDKVMLLQELVTKYEWLHWLDLDTLFMNMHRDPLDFLDPDYDLHVTKDANGLNTGSFYVRSSTWSRKLLADVWKHNDGGQSESDQRSFKAVIDKLPGHIRAQHVKFYSQKLFNEYPDPIVNFMNWKGHFKEGDYLIHFPGTYCGLSPNGQYTDQHLLECLHKYAAYFVAAE